MRTGKAQSTKEPVKDIPTLNNEKGFSRTGSLAFCYSIFRKEWVKLDYLMSRFWKDQSPSTVKAIK